MPKQLLLLLLMVLVLPACFRGKLYVPPSHKVDDDNEVDIQTPNGGDNLDDSQLKNAFSLNMTVNWYYNNEKTPGQKDPLVDIHIQDPDYTASKKVDTLMGDNNNLPDDAILGIFISQTENSNSLYHTDIKATIMITKPDGKKESTKMTIKPNGSYFLHLGSQPNTKGEYQIEVVATRAGLQETLFYHLPLVHINLLRHTDELYFKTPEDTMKALNISVVYLNSDWWIKDVDERYHIEEEYSSDDFMSIPLGWNKTKTHEPYHGVIYNGIFSTFSIGIKLDSVYMKNKYNNNNLQIKFYYQYKSGQATPSYNISFTNRKIQFGLTDSIPPRGEVAGQEPFIQLYVTSIRLKVDTKHYIYLKDQNSYPFLFSYGCHGS